MEEWFLDVSSPMGLANPKPENRNLKEIRNPKLETTHLLVAIQTDSPMAPWLGSESLRNGPSPRPALGLFGFRISGFLRVSDFGFRICSATRSPAENEQPIALASRA